MTQDSVGAIDAHLRKLLPSTFVRLVQHHAEKALSLKTSSTVILRLTKSTKHVRFLKKLFKVILLFLALNQ